MAILFYFVAVMAVIGVMLGSYVLGQRHRDKATDFPYESGIMTTGNARLRFPAQFYLIAMFFVIFDLESIFVFIWSVAVRELGWRGFIHMSFFIGVLLISLFYLWRSDALLINNKQSARKHLSNWLVALLSRVPKIIFFSPSSKI
jgi:NADH-quinone oxidoreductase subunit A